MPETSNQKQELPLVSIVTPTFNQAEYIVETIESVLAQTYPNIEYIVLDDGSTDNTQEVLSRFNGRIRHEQHSNVGQAETLNRGWAMSSGSLLGYLSSDDLLKPHAVTNLVQTLLDHPFATVVYCDFDLIDSTGSIIRQVRTENFSINRLKRDLVCQPGPGALFSREVFDQAGGWNDALRQVPDFEFWLRASRFGPFIRAPEILASYRIHEGSASFRPTTEERSMEIVGVMTKYWGGLESPEAKKSIATARLIAAKSHLQSGRLVASLRQWSSAVSLSPSVLLSPSAWRMMLSGFLRRFLYRLRGRV